MMVMMIQEYRNVIGKSIILVIVRMLMSQENRNVIGKSIILVITKTATTK